MEINKVIIWGFNYDHFNTYSHIHSAYYETFKSMGFDAYWFPDEVKEGLDLHNSLFLTMGAVDSNIPILEDSVYVLHHCNIEKYSKCKILNLCNYVRYCEDGIGWNYPNSKVIKIKDFFFYDEQNKALYQPWATNLIPLEIIPEKVCLYDPTKQDVNYIGSIYEENVSEVTPFIQSCEKHGKKFNHHYGISDFLNYTYTRDSYIAPDIRGPWHKECGYIPCRVFKNISYGKYIGTNSKHIKQMFGDLLCYCDNTYDLFDVTEDNYRVQTKEMIWKSMEYIKNNHTYVNRINNILYALENL